MGGLFRGMGSVLLREVPQFAIYYPWYEFREEKVQKTAILVLL